MAHTGLRPSQGKWQNGRDALKRTLLFISLVLLILFSTALPPSTALPSHRELTVHVDYRETIGAFNRLSGAQGSPSPDVEGDREKIELFRDFHVSLCRFPQDCKPNSLTLAAIFPDGAANPDDPASYHFSAVDRHIRSARQAGCEILWQSSYDVGLSDSWMGGNLGGRAPRDVTRWCRVVERCLEHFNNGWNGGFTYGVRYVEFVNEPNGLGGFRGGDASRLIPAFLAFLDMVARYNQKHPDTPVKACGPGIPFSWDEWKSWEPRLRKLLATLKEKKSALPVLSFHTYGRDTSPLANAQIAAAYRRLLDEYGMKGTELWNSEWQGSDFLVKSLGIREPPARAHFTEQELKTFSKGLATYALSCKVRWQGVLDGSSYYLAHMRAFPEGFKSKARENNVYAALMFTPDNRANPLALQEKLTWLIKTRTPMRCRTGLSVDDGLFSALGARSESGETLCLLLCNLKAIPRTVTLELAVPEKTERSSIRLLTFEGEKPFSGAAEKIPAKGTWIATMTIAPLESCLLIMGKDWR
jgi:hypothetical protein